MDAQNGNSDVDNLEFARVDLARLRSTFLQYVVDLGDVLLELSTTLAHGLEELVEHLIEELLALHIAQTAATVVILQLVEVLVLWPEVGEVLVAGEGVEIGEDGVALHMAGIVEVDVLRIGVHRAHLLPDVIGRVREVDAVAERLRHLLLAVGAWQTTGGEVLTSPCRRCRAGDGR